MADELLDEDEAESDAEMPSGMERRLVLQLLSYWRDLFAYVYEDENEEAEDDRRYPSLSDVNRSNMKEIWQSCFLLDLTESGEAVFRDTGDEYASYYPGRLDMINVDDLTADTLAQHSTAYLPEVIAKGVPITRGGEFTNGDGELVLYRSIILPLSDDGETIDGFIGGANCRIVSEA